MSRGALHASPNRGGTGPEAVVEPRRPLDPICVESRRTASENLASSRGWNWRAGAPGARAESIQAVTPGRDATDLQRPSHLQETPTSCRWRSMARGRYPRSCKRRSPRTVQRCHRTDAGSLISPTGLGTAGGLRSTRTPTPRAAGWQVSVAGGTWPLWGRDGRELFYMAPDGCADGRAGEGHRLRRGRRRSPVKVLEPGYWSQRCSHRPSDTISRSDGKRFLVVTPPREVADPPELVVIQHWDEELEALLAKK